MIVIMKSNQQREKWTNRRREYTPDHYRRRSSAFRAPGGVVSRSDSGSMDFLGMFPECTLTIEYTEMMRYYMNSIHFIWIN